MLNSLAPICERVQTLLGRHQLQGAEAYLESRERLVVQAKDGDVETLGRSHEVGVALRLERDGKIGFAYTTDLSEGALERMVDLSYNGGFAVEPKEPQQLPRTAWPQVGENGEQFDGGLASRSLSEKIACALRLEEAARRYDPRIKQVRGATYQEDTEETLIWNRQAGEQSYRRTLCELQVMVMAADAKSQESAWEMDFSPCFAELDPRAVARKAAADAVGMLGAGPLPTGRYAAVLDRAVVTACLGILAPSFLAESIQKRKSRLVGRQGEKIYAPTICLIDDGRYPGGYLSAPFDGEGVVSQTTALVRNGVLEHYLYDTVTAAIDGVASTGNSVRSSFKEVPRPGTRNFYLQAGRLDRSELLAGMKRGVEICDVIGIHTANAITGDFSVGASGYRITDGRRDGAVRGFAISGNLHDLLASASAVASDLKFYGSVGAPSVRIAHLDVGGA